MLLPETKLKIPETRCPVSRKVIRGSWRTQQDFVVRVASSVAQIATPPTSRNRFGIQFLATIRRGETCFVLIAISGAICAEGQMGLIGKLKSIWSVPDIQTYDSALTRERLIKNGRIVFIDDEHPLLIDELKQAHFAVDHDADGSDLTKFDNQLYDVAILDYHGVGQRLGTGQGLDLLKYVRRVSPGTRVIAYTSRSLSAAESEFFRLSHAVLPKDMGLGDSLAVVEGELRKALSKEHLYEALMMKLNVTSTEEKHRLRKALAQSLAGNNDRKLKESIIAISGAAALKAAEMIVGKLIG